MVAQNLYVIVLTLVILAVLLGVGFVILGTFQQQLQAMNQTAAANQVAQVGSALSLVTSWLPIIVIVSIAAIVLGLVLAFGRMRGR